MIYNKGYIGDKGERGEQGERGPEGFLGKRGEDGKDFVILPNRYVIVYRASIGVPNKPNGGEYNFKTNELKVDGWNTKLNFDNSVIVYACEGLFTAKTIDEVKCTNVIWGEPYRIKGNKGSDNDGMENIFHRNNDPNYNEKPTENEKNIDRFVPRNWTDKAQGVTENLKYEWYCYRTKDSEAKEWSDWVGPFISSQYGSDGYDGDSIEQIFYYGEKSDIPPINPTIIDYKINEEYQRKDYVPNGWHDNPISPTKGQDIIWMSQRKQITEKIEGVRKKIWDRFSNPQVWSEYFSDGEKGTALNVIDVFVTFVSVDITDNGKTLNIVTHENHRYNVDEDKLGDMSCVIVGDAIFIVNDGIWTKSKYTYTGGIRYNIYVHIKYGNENLYDFLYKEDKSDRQKGFTRKNGEDESEAYFIGLKYDANEYDSDDPKDYDWSAMRGEDGFGVEYIFTRTEDENSRPKVPTSVDNKSNWSGIDENGVEWTDNPKGVNPTLKYEWYCKRKRKSGGKWGDFEGEKDYAKLFHRYSYSNIETGKDGLYIYPMGEWDETVIYTKTETMTPYVFVRDGYKFRYFIFWCNGDITGSTKESIEGGTVVNPLTPDDETWMECDSFSAIVTDFIIANGGNFGSAVFFDRYMFSMEGINSSGKKQIYGDKNPFFYSDPCFVRHPFYNDNYDSKTGKNAGYKNVFEDINSKLYKNGVFLEVKSINNKLSVNNYVCEEGSNITIQHVYHKEFSDLEITLRFYTSNGITYVFRKNQGSVDADNGMDEFLWISFDGFREFTLSEWKPSLCFDFKYGRTYTQNGKIIFSDEEKSFLVRNGLGREKFSVERNGAITIDANIEGAKIEIDTIKDFFKYFIPAKTDVVEINDDKDVGFFVDYTTLDNDDIKNIINEEIIKKNPDLEEGSNVTWFGSLNSRDFYDFIYGIVYKYGFFYHLRNGLLEYYTVKPYKIEDKEEEIYVIITRDEKNDIPFQHFGKSNDFGIVGESIYTDKNKKENITVKSILPLAHKPLKYTISHQGQTYDEVFGYDIIEDGIKVTVKTPEGKERKSNYFPYFSSYKKNIYLGNDPETGEERYSDNFDNSYNVFSLDMSTIGSELIINKAPYLNGINNDNDINNDKVFEKSFNSPIKIVLPCYQTCESVSADGTGPYEFQYREIYEKTYEKTFGAGKTEIESEIGEIISNIYIGGRKISDEGIDFSGIPEGISSKNYKIQIYGDIRYDFHDEIFDKPYYVNTPCRLFEDNGEYHYLNFGELYSFNGKKIKIKNNTDNVMLFDNYLTDIYSVAINSDKLIYDNINEDNNVITVDTGDTTYNNFICSILRGMDSKGNIVNGGMFNYGIINRSKNNDFIGGICCSYIKFYDKNKIYKALLNDNTLLYETDDECKLYANGVRVKTPVLKPGEEVELEFVIEDIDKTYTISSYGLSETDNKLEFKKPYISTNGDNNTSLYKFIYSSDNFSRFNDPEYNFDVDVRVESNIDEDFFKVFLKNNVLQEFYTYRNENRLEKPVRMYWKVVEKENIDESHDGDFFDIPFEIVITKNDNSIVTNSSSVINTSLFFEISGETFYFKDGDNTYLSGSTGDIKRIEIKQHNKNNNAEKNLYLKNIGGDFEIVLSCDEMTKNQSLHIDGSYNNNISVKNIEFEQINLEGDKNFINCLDLTSIMSDSVSISGYENIEELIVSNKRALYIDGETTIKTLKLLDKDPFHKGKAFHITKDSDIKIEKLELGFLPYYDYNEFKFYVEFRDRKVLYEEFGFKDWLKTVREIVLTVDKDEFKGKWNYLYNTLTDTFGEPTKIEGNFIYTNKNESVLID